MPRFVVGYTTREIMLLEFSSSIMCLILSGKVGSNIASEIGTMRVTQQIDALEIMGVNSAGYLILPKIIALMTMIPFLVIFSISSGIIGAFCTCWFGGVMNAEDPPMVCNIVFRNGLYGAVLLNLSFSLSSFPVYLLISVTR